MYTTRDFKKGTDVRLAVVAFLLAEAVRPGSGKAVQYYQPGPFGGNEKRDDDFIVLEGPHYPEPHSWYMKAVSRGFNIVWVNGLPAILNPTNPKYNLPKGLDALRAKYPDVAAKVAEANRPHLPFGTVGDILKSIGKM